MKTNEQKCQLVELLVSERFVGDAIVAILQKEATEKGAHVFDLLLERGVITHTEIGMAKANHYSVEFVILERIQISNDVLRAVLPRQAHNFRVFPIEDSGEGLILATDDLLELNEFEELTEALGRSCEFRICASDAMDEVLDQYYFSGKESGQLLRKERLSAQADQPCPS